MKKDIILTLFVQLFVMISVLLSYKLAMNYYAENGFSEYSLIKRNIALISPLIMLGLGTALTRYIALSVDNSKNIQQYFISSFFFMLISFIFLGVLTTLFSTCASIALYGNNTYIRFLLPMYFSLLGLSLHVLVYSYYRGNLDMGKANILQLLNLGIIPLLAFVFAKVPEEVYFYSGLMTIVLLIPILFRIMYINNLNMTELYINGKQLISYGIQRVPGDFGIMALFSLPVLIATHIYGVEVGGHVAFGIALLNMSGQAVAPLGVIFLPKISQLIAQKEFSTIRIYVKKLFMTSFCISFGIMILFYIFADDILKLYLDNVTSSLLNITKNIAIGIIGFMLYVTLRGVIDAYHEKGINTLNIILGLASSSIIYLILYFSNNLANINNIIYTFLVGLFIITFFTLTVVYTSIRKAE